MIECVTAQDTERWNNLLARCKSMDVSHAPEFHSLYAGRIKGAEPLMIVYKEGGHYFCYPLLLSPVSLFDSKHQEHNTDFKDISSAYGYSGPIASTSEQEFLHNAWLACDTWAHTEGVVAEFVRFSHYAANTCYAHPDCTVLSNRPLAVSYLPPEKESFLAKLNSKTRNMLRKAWKSDLHSEELPLKEGLVAFRTLYELTMDRNQAVGFFLYDDQFYQQLLAFPAGMVRLFGVYKDGTLIAAAIALIHNKQAYYFLGASIKKFSSLGAGNLALYQMSISLIEAGVEFINVGGGRGTTEQDPLFRFKKSNSTDVVDFKIGKRVLQQSAYNSLVSRWETMNGKKMTSPKILFYREY